MLVVFGEDHVRYLRYDAPWASVYPHGALAIADIRDADGNGLPPEIRTVAGETLFVPRGQGAELADFARRHGIPHVTRPDVWADLLEPFLDTWFDEDHVAATARRLVDTGLTSDRVAVIRERVRPLMVAYNFDSMLWDYFNLNLFDLVTAAAGALVPSDLPAVTLGDLRGFYTWAMRIADMPGPGGAAVDRAP